MTFCLCFAVRSVLHPCYSSCISLWQNTITVETVSDIRLSWGLWFHLILFPHLNCCNLLYAALIGEQSTGWVNDWLTNPFEVFATRSKEHWKLVCLRLHVVASWDLSVHWVTSFPLENSEKLKFLIPKLTDSLITQHGCRAENTGQAAALAVTIQLLSCHPFSLFDCAHSFPVFFALFFSRTYTTYTFFLTHCFSFTHTQLLYELGLITGFN